MRVVDTLCGTPRVGWLQRGIRNAETVGEHVMLVSFLSLTAAEALSRRGIDIDVGRVAIIALLHDFAEAYLGHASEELRGLMDWRAAEIAAMEKRVPELLKYYVEYRDMASPEGALVAFMDKYATLVRACSYDAADDLARALYGKLTALLDRLSGHMRDVLREILVLTCGRCPKACGAD